MQIKVEPSNQMELGDTEQKNRSDYHQARGNKLPGWTMKGKGLDSPRGVHFVSKSKALEHVMANGGLQEEVDELKKLFLADGWTMDRLPRGWLGKGTIHQKFFFTAPDGTTFTGKHKAAAYLRSVLAGGEVDCKLIMDFCPVAGKLVKRDRTGRGWDESKTLERATFVPPPQDSSSELWKERMVAANASCLEAELEQLMRLMGEAKVVEETTLEESSDIEANHVLEQSSGLTNIKSEQIDAHDENQEKPGVSSPDFLAQPLPAGWSLSSSGEVTPPSNLPLIFPNRRNAFQALTLSKCNEEMLRLKDEMFDQLELEGWRASTLLPPGWIYNYQGPHSLTFLDKAGHFFDCVEVMVAWLSSQGMAQSVIQSVLALQAQFERLQAELPTEAQEAMESKNFLPKTFQELPEAEVTASAQPLVLAPRLIKLQAPRALETIETIKTEASKMLREEAGTGSTMITEPLIRVEGNHRTFPSLPGWQRHGPKGLVRFNSFLLPNVYTYTY